MASKKSAQNQTDTKYSRVKILHENLPVGKFAVFIRSPNGSRAFFRSLHQTEKDATEVAQMHASELASSGLPDFTCYVIEIKNRMGIEHGKCVY